jgi:CheY-like chemotaxis protein
MSDTPSQGSALRVLIVDDNHDMTDSCALLLRLWGYDVSVANRRHDAIGIAASWSPDVALLDLAMPGMDGIRLARWLHSMDGLHELTLIAVTGVAGEAARTQAEADLIKPSGVTPLMCQLAEWCQRLLPIGLFLGIYETRPQEVSPCFV